MTQHTQAPWSVPHFARDDTECDCAYIFGGHDHAVVCIVQVDDGKPISQGGNDAPPLEEAKANAHLIAAAPELLEALEWFCARVDNGEVRSIKSYDKFASLIEKVRGQQ